MASDAANDQRTKAPRLPNWAWLAGLLIFTLAVRGSVLWAMRGKLEQDPDAYREIAENLLKHGEFALGKDDPTSGAPLRPTAYRPPLYPVVLSSLPAADGQHISLAKVAALHLLLGVATVWLTWFTARRYSTASSDSPGVIAAPLVAGALVACDPILLNQQALVMTETLAAFLAILSLWCLARFDTSRSWFNASLAGGAIGLGILCRPTFLPWLMLVAVVIIILRHPRGQMKEQSTDSPWIGFVGRRIANVAALAIASAVIITPWPVRNLRVLGEPIVTTTHGGYTLLLGNNDAFYRWLINDKSGIPWNVGNEPGTALYLRQADAMDDMTRRTGRTAELGIDRDCYRDAYQSIAAAPHLFLYSCAYRLFQLWSPLPHQLKADESLATGLLRYLAAAWYCAVYVLAGFGIWQLRWKLIQPPWVWGVLLCLAFTAVHTFYWTNLRMRAPLMPFVALIAAAAVGSGPRRQA
jgi:hypothetical protein